MASGGCQVGQSDGWRIKRLTSGADGAWCDMSSAHNVAPREYNLPISRGNNTASFIRRILSAGPFLIVFPPEVRQFQNV